MCYSEIYSLPAIIPMARLARFSIPNLPQHIIQRGNNKGIIFTDKADYQYYLQKLADACNQFDCSLHAYVLMSNHVHLLLTPHTEHAISKVMQSIGRYYVQYFNKKHHRTGTLWEGRYRATLIDSETYLLICYRYIELNPVRAHMVKLPADYPWSSFQHNALGKKQQWLKPHALYSRLGKNNSERCTQYLALFDQAIPDNTLDAIRDATNKAWVLGNTEFLDKIQHLSKRQTQPKPRGRSKQTT